MSLCLIDQDGRVRSRFEAAHTAHPNVVKACRPRSKAAASKSDPGDAFLLADVLRTDGHRFTPLRPLSDETRALRALARRRGCDHPHAVRVLARAWIRVLWRCWHDHQPYTPARHDNLDKLLAHARTTQA